MLPFNAKSAAEQVAAHLRGEILRGELRGGMPGKETLAAMLGVNHKTVRAAIELLEKQGLLEAQGPGRCRRIVLPKGHAPPALRLAFLPYEENDRSLDFLIELRNRLQDAGHTIEWLQRTLLDLDMDVRKVSRVVGRTKADAWVVLGGSHEVLKWFSERESPALALFGRHKSMNIAAAGSDKWPALEEALHLLVELGHRRIVYLAHEERRKPFPGVIERQFISELESLGIQVGAYNLPDWSYTIDDFHRCLDSLFKHTPPTALIIDQVPQLIAAQNHLARRGVLAPRDVSLLVLHAAPDMEWCRPAVSHVRWDPHTVLQAVIRWANNIARGKNDRTQTHTVAEFIRGETIGPVPKRK